MGGQATRPSGVGVGAFGEKLRKQREQRGLALDVISNITKISTRMLRALEDEHFDQLPGGVFNKGFVRAYARQVGLDEEEAVADYLEALRESQVQSQQILPDFRSPVSKPGTATPQDARHHILPTSDRPGGDGRGKESNDLPATDRRKQDRRNRDDGRRTEIRRSQDRNGNVRNGHDRHRNENEDRGKGYREDVPLAGAVSAPVSRKSESSEHASRQQAHPLHDSHDEDRRIEERQHDTTGMSGFITLGSEAGDATEPTDPQSPRFWRIIVAAAVLIVIVGLVVTTVYHSRRETASAVPFSNSIASQTSAQAPASAVASTPAPSAKTEAPTPAAKPAREKPSPTAPPQPAKTLAQTLAPKPAPNLNSDDTPIKKIIPEAPASNPPNTFTLLIRAEQTTWVSIFADGKPVIHEMLIAPAHTSVRAAHDVTVRVGNAAGVSFLLNGKEFPAQGNAGEVKTYVFDATGFKAMVQPPVQPPLR